MSLFSDKSQAPKYLPVADDKSAYWEVYTHDPVRVWEAHKSCLHPATTYFNICDLRADNMQRYYGQCCIACGRIMSIEPVT